MAYDPTDAITARKLLEDALALTSTPSLTTDQVDRAFAVTSSLNDDDVVVYLPIDLDRAAAWGWGIKAGLTADSYDLGGGPGIKLDESQWHEHCLGMQARYRDGSLSVVGNTTRRSGIGSVKIYGSLAAEEW